MTRHVSVVGNLKKKGSKKMDKLIQKYQHVTTESKKVNVELSQEQQSLIFFAYDYGLSSLNDVEKLNVLNSIISDLKNALHK